MYSDLLVLFVKGLIVTKFISWNVNGLRACMQKGFIDFVKDQGADYICIQETKMQENQAEVALEGAIINTSTAQKKKDTQAQLFSHPIHHCL